MRNGYASVEDVRGLLSFVPTFSATTKPNGSQVAGFIAMASDDLDAALAVQDYETPVPTSASYSFELLRDWSTVGGAYYAAAAMPQGIDSKHLSIYERRWDAILKGITEGDLEMPGDASKDPTKSNTRYALNVEEPYGASPYFTRNTLVQ